MRKINITLVCDDDHEAYHLEKLLKDNYKDVDVTYLTNTKKMYEEDANFRELCMKVKAAKRARNVYINEHNGKYTKEY